LYVQVVFIYRSSYVHEFEKTKRQDSRREQKIEKGRGARGNREGVINERNKKDRSLVKA
jgi:hypothetical protein